LLRKVEQLLKVEGFGASAESLAERQSQLLEADIRGAVNSLLNNSEVSKALRDDTTGAYSVGESHEETAGFEPSTQPVLGDDIATSKHDLTAAQRELGTRDSIEAVIRKAPRGESRWGVQTQLSQRLTSNGLTTVLGRLRLRCRQRGLLGAAQGESTIAFGRSRISKTKSRASIANDTTQSQWPDRSKILGGYLR
jgi:hypothetical protein